jgi:hypothetical protein
MPSPLEILYIGMMHKPYREHKAYLPAGGVSTAEVSAASFPIGRRLGNRS